MKASASACGPFSGGSPNQNSIVTLPLVFSTVGDGKELAAGLAAGEAALVADAAAVELVALVAALVAALLLAALVLPVVAVAPPPEAGALVGAFVGAALAVVLLLDVAVVAVGLLDPQAASNSVTLPPARPVSNCRRVSRWDGCRAAVMFPSYSVCPIPHYSA
ncbi:MAG TPA: hypothetical protein VFU78_17030 [Thermomicrobiales bacterium]|nr:hypothetical protein [Thermomicrobiales bacterium]